MATKLYTPRAIFQLHYSKDYRTLRDIEFRVRTGQAEIAKEGFPTDPGKAQLILSRVAGIGLKTGLYDMRIPSGSVDRIVSYMILNDQIPQIVLDTTLSNYNRTSEIHPDQYPFTVRSSDLVYTGLVDTGIDTQKALEHALCFFSNKRLTPSNIEKENSGIGVTNILELYALAVDLNREK